MLTQHTINYSDARFLDHVADESVHLVVTSPPYPMIAMWDEVFSAMNTAVDDLLKAGEGMAAFDAMHGELDKVWNHLHRVLVPGGFACINIGDATRTIGGQFRLYPNHSRVIQAFSALGFHVLPEVIWRKPANSPTKFMGSGMLPCGAYVTLEHEMILVFRKPTKRAFAASELENRRSSSYFWEERNKWFTDVWELNGMRQALNAKEVRNRSAAYPIEIPFRLVSMYSSKFDTVLDPFLGTATTMYAAIALCRSCIGYETEVGLRELHQSELLSDDVRSTVNAITENRIAAHWAFLDNFRKRGREPGYANQYGMPVVTKQETGMSIERLVALRQTKIDSYVAEYEPWNTDNRPCAGN